MEGIGGLIIGAAAVLLAVNFFKGKKAESPAGTPALAAPPEAGVAKPAAKPVAKRAPARKDSPAATASPAAKRPSRARAKPAAAAATPSETPES